MGTPAQQGELQHHLTNRLPHNSSCSTSNIMSDAAENVKFNVGGKHFEVSRALIDSHAESVLGKLVSDTWYEDPNKAVFIDRDGDIFAQILNYLRYGSIELPITIPRSMFDRELDYYGITSAEDRISDQESLARTLKSLVEPVAKAKREHELFLLALECYYKFCHSDHAFTDGASVNIHRADHRLFNGKKSVDLEERKLFDKYLERYFGLEVHPSYNVNKDGASFNVCMKK